jgi:hypothetical protein
VNGGGHGFSHLMFLRAVVAHPWPARERCGILAVATALASHAQARSGDRCFPSTETLEVESGLSRHTVLKAKRRLRDAGFLDYAVVGRAHSHHYTLKVPTVAVQQEHHQTHRGSATGAPRQERRSGSSGHSLCDENTASRCNRDTQTTTREHTQKRTREEVPRKSLSQAEDQTGLTPPDIDYDWANMIAINAAQSGRFLDLTSGRDHHSSIRKQILGALGEGKSKAAITEALKAHMASGAVRKSWDVLDEVVRRSAPEQEIYDPYEEVEYQAATTDQPARGGSDR